MGRYAQRLRRGGGARGLNPVTVVEFLEGGGSTLSIQFSAAVVGSTGAIAGTGVVCNAQTIVNVVSIVGAFVTVTFTGAVPSGAAWLVSAQPNWLTTPVVIPANGTVTS